MSVEAAVYDILSNTVGVTNIVGDRIYPIGMPPGKAVPAIIYQQISSVNITTCDGEGDVRDDRIQITCWDDDPDGARTLSEAVRKAMASASGSHGSITVRYCIIEDEGDTFNIAGESERLDRYGKRQDWQICY